MSLIQTLKNLPWKAIRRVFYELRKRHFQTPVPEQKLQKIDMGLREFRVHIGRQGYEPEWPLSYYYYNEDLNARKYIYRPNQQFPHGQIHIRAWDRDDGTYIYAHEEPSALHHPKAHLSDEYMTDVTGWVRDNLDQLNARNQ